MSVAYGEQQRHSAAFGEPKFGAPAAGGYAAGSSQRELERQYHVVLQDSLGHPSLGFRDGTWYRLSVAGPQPMQLRGAIGLCPHAAGSIVQITCWWMRENPLQPRSLDLATELALTVGELVRVCPADSLSSSAGDLLPMAMAAVGATVAPAPTPALPSGNGFGSTSSSSFGAQTSSSFGGGVNGYGAAPDPAAALSASQTSQSSLSSSSASLPTTGSWFDPADSSGTGGFPAVPPPPVAGQTGSYPTASTASYGTAATSSTGSYGTASTSSYGTAATSSYSTDSSYGTTAGYDTTAYQAAPAPVAQTNGHSAGYANGTAQTASRPYPPAPAGYGLGESQAALPPASGAGAGTRRAPDPSSSGDWSRSAAQASSAAPARPAGRGYGDPSGSGEWERPGAPRRPIQGSTVPNGQPRPPAPRPAANGATGSHSVNGANGSGAANGGGANGAPQRPRPPQQQPRPEYREDRRDGYDRRGYDEESSRSSSDRLPGGRQQRPAAQPRGTMGRRPASRPGRPSEY